MQDKPTFGERDFTRQAGTRRLASHAYLTGQMLGDPEHPTLPEEDLPE